METIKTTPALVQDYFDLFVNRAAFTMQSLKPDPETGKNYYFRPKQKGSDAPVRLTPDVVRQHLEGEITIGLYAINPSTQRCRWVAIDADYKHSMEDLLKLQFYLNEDKVEPALEMSRRGGHLWIFMETPLLAKDCRAYIYHLASKLEVPVKTGLGDGIEVFPKHDFLAPGEFGNALRAPLGIHRGAGKRFFFYGADYSLEKQMAYLKSLRRLREQELQGFVAKIPPPPPVVAPQPTTRKVFTGQIATSKKEFRILDFVRCKPRPVGRNYVGRCPSCAKTGHDRHGDNLAVKVSDTRYYRCFAGCTKEMIREALGQPIRHRQMA